jgi:hypothetical protein
VTETRDELTDIAWLRGLAEEGAQAPVRGASILMAAGAIYGLASLGHWAAATGLLPGGLSRVPFIWLGATVLFLMANGLIVWRLRGSAGVRTAANRAMTAAWVGVGWGIFVLFASMAVSAYRAGPSPGLDVFWLVPSIIMVFYGVGWAVSAAMTRLAALWWLAIGSFVAAPVLAAFAGSDHQYLAYAVALFGLMALPGCLLMRAAKG